MTKGPFVFRFQLGFVDMDLERIGLTRHDWIRAMRENRPAEFHKDHTVLMRPIMRFMPSGLLQIYEAGLRYNRFPVHVYIDTMTDVWPEFRLAFGAEPCMVKGRRAFRQANSKTPFSKLSLTDTGATS